MARPESRDSIFMRGQFLAYLRKPLVEHRLRAGIERRKSTNDSCLALCNDQFGSGDDKHWRADYRNAQFTLEQGRQ
jgi:hypothetical protein